MKSLMLKVILLSIAYAILANQVFAHHILGRPSYSLNEDSNTPSSIQAEVTIGDFNVNYMVYPAFPRSGETGRINFYVSHATSGKSYDGRVYFSVAEDSWFSSHSEVLGRQTADDHVFHQNFVFDAEGDYIISAQFIDNGESYTVDLPLRVGSPTFGYLELSVGVVIILLLVANTLRQKKLQRIRVKRHHAEADNLTGL